MSKVSGRCLCGGVTYSSDAEPVAQAICHCTNCQRQSGAPFSIVIGVPTAAFHVAGDTLATIQTEADTHERPTTRHFCSACGSPIYSSVEEMPDVVYVKAGTLDDASWLAPNAEVFTRSAQPWAPHIEGAMQFETMPGA
jgi:hypothetical protein